MTAETGYFTTHDAVKLRTRTWTIDNPRYDILLVHGLWEHSGRFDHVAEFFNNHGANVYSYDVRGHGESGGEPGHLDSMEDVYNDISAMATATAASTGRPWVLYGHSFGGFQSGGYLLNGYEPHPNVAVLSSPWMLTVRKGDGVLKALSSIAGTIVPSITVPRQGEGHQLAKDPSVGEAYESDPLVLKGSTTGMAKVIFAEQNRLESRHGELKTPTFVFHGSDDEMVAPKASAGLAASDPVTRKVYPDCRHELHNEPEGMDILGDVADWIESKLF